MIGREKERTFLRNLFISDSPLAIPSLVHVTGCSGTGKSFVIQSLLNSSTFYVDCKEWIDQRSFYSELLQHYHQLHNLSAHKNVPSKGDLFTLRSLLIARNHHTSARCNLVIIFDHFDWLSAEDIEQCINPLVSLAASPFISLQRTSSLSAVLVSNRISPLVSSDAAVHIHFETYSKDEIVQILLFRLKHFSHLSFLTALVEITVDYFYQMYPDLTELINICARTLDHFCVDNEPALINNSVSTTKLFKLLLPFFKTTFSSFYSVTCTATCSTLQHLPTLTKQLLLCAFLASARQAKHDISLFSSSHRRTRKSTRTLSSSSSATATATTQSNNKSASSMRQFPVERVFALFRNVFSSEMTLAVSESDLLMQLATLSKYSLVSISNQSEMLTGMRMRCNLTLEDAKSVAKLIGFSITKYLL